MRKYNIQNYIRYKNDVEKQLERVRKPVDGDYTDLTDEEIKINFLPLVVTLAHKQSTSDQASGVLSILDLFQEGNRESSRHKCQHRESSCILQTYQTLKNCYCELSSHCRKIQEWGLIAGCVRSK